MDLLGIYFVFPVGYIIASAIVARASGDRALRASAMIFHVEEYPIKNKHIHNYFSFPDSIDIIQHLERHDFPC
jgi:hypothetical protein